MNKAEHKKIPQIMEVLKTMWMPQKIRLANKMWQDAIASNDKTSSPYGAASYKEASSQDDTISSKDALSLDGTA